MGAKAPQATVSGPGIDQGYETPAVALSAAITLAQQADGETTLYVRRSDGSPYGRIERDAGGSVLITRIEKVPNGGPGITVGFEWES